MVKILETSYYSTLTALKMAIKFKQNKNVRTIIFLISGKYVPMDQCMV